MTQSNPPSLLGRLVFWLLGAALFISIALLPNALLARFYSGGQVHSIVVPLVAVLLVLMWGSSWLLPRHLEGNGG